VDRVVSDPVVASRLVDRGVERLADFDLDTTAEVIVGALERLLRGN
jgi:hypothetical protein